MKKELVITIDPKGDFANWSFLNLYDKFIISLDKNEVGGYSFNFTLHENYANTIFTINPVIFNTPIIKTDSVSPLVTLFLAETRYHTYSTDNILNQVIFKVIEDNIDKIKATITELLESVILDEKD